MDWNEMNLHGGEPQTQADFVDFDITQIEADLDGLDLPLGIKTLLDMTKARLQAQGERIKELERLSVEDELTGLLNRRGFENQVRRELAKLQRGQGHEGGVLLLIDLDDFKSVNDTYGHLAGDACLVKLADHLRAVLRESDVIARLAGDEFAVLLTEIKPIRARQLLGEKGSLRQRLADIPVPWNGGEIRISASFGYSHYAGDEDYTDIFTAADADLYAQKAQDQED